MTKPLAATHVGEYRRLVNLAAASAGSIHDDSAAQALGFRGAFVPGSVVGTKALLAATALLGHRWFDGGYYDLTFVSPVYTTDDVRETGRPRGDAVDLAVETRDGRLCCAGRAGLGSANPWGDEPGGSTDGNVLPGVPLGFSFGERGFVVRPEEAVRLAAASADSTPWYTGASPWGAPVAPPETLHREALDLVRTQRLEIEGVLNPGMWAGHALVLRAPIFLDTPYVMNERVVDKGRSGRTIFLTYEFRINTDTEEIAVGRHKVKWLAAERAS